MEYETFAHVYDEIMDDSLYEKWLAFTKRHLRSDQKKVLELACGTGILALKLAEDGYDVTALDISQDMLAVASERMAKEYPEESFVQFIQGDMMALSEVGENYQAVTCYSDSLCYMSDALEVQQVFDEVYRVLDNDGTFIFDVHSAYKIEKLFKDFEFQYETDDYAFLWHSELEDKPLSVVHELSFYIRKKNNLFERYLEDHHERTYHLDHYLTMLESAGFTNVEVYADFTDEAPTDTSERLFFVAHKGV